MRLHIRIKRIHRHDHRRVQTYQRILIFSLWYRFGNSHANVCFGRRNVSNPASWLSPWCSIHTLLMWPRGSSFPENAMPRVALVVDDSMLIRHTVCRFLEERGFSVESASNGQDAVEALKRVRPDLIVTDMQMPKMSGGELITSIKAKPETANIPIVIVAGRQSGFEKKENRANFTIFKDIDIESQLAKGLRAIFGECPVKGQAAAT